MKVFPSSNHFKVTMYVNSIIGLWPLMFKNHPLLRSLYNLYSNFVLLIFILFNISSSIEVIRLATVGGGTAQEIFKNLCITLLDSIILTKAFVMRSPKMVGLVREVIEVEEKIQKNKDKEVIKIYESYISETHRTSVIFIVNYVLVTFSYYFVPLVTPTVTFNEATNETTIERELPGSAWVPWDAQRYYWASYGWHLYAGGIAASSVMSMDVFMFSLIIFPLGQIDALCHNLRNFREHSRRVQNLLGCSKEKASLMVFRKYVLKHKDIIRYIDDFNDGVRYVMVFDFLVSSIQLAAIVVQLVGAELEPLDLLLWCSFVLCMLMRLFIYYWYANEIMVKSSNIANALWESDWVQEPYKIKHLMLIMITRSQRELGLDIGPFSKMTLDSFLNIVKAAYSYATVMYR